MRVQLALKHLPYLIRKNLNDLDIIFDDLTETLLRLHLNEVAIENFEKYKLKSLISLTVLRPKMMSK